MPQADWPGVVVIWAPFERQKVHIFDRAKLSGFATSKFTTKGDLSAQKQVFVFNLRFWLPQKPKF